mmetsp:Transcript_110102/g.267690  ORF Transcript_110102/g.267690 Transcript_110102/m.267690 type:complete len:220 (+) Transcript_110102:1870-2529(+)
MGPKLLATNFVTANSTRSGRRERRMIIACSSEHFESHSPGSGSFSGAADMYHRFQSRGVWSNELTMPPKARSLSSSVMLSQAVGSSQSDTGLVRCSSLSMTRPPRRKKFHSSVGILASRCIFLTQICKDSNSLWRSNRPRHVYLYTSYVWKVLIAWIRSASSSDPPPPPPPPRSRSRLFSMLITNKSTYASSENWYIGSTEAKSLSTKNKSAARADTGR